MFWLGTGLLVELTGCYSASNFALPTFSYSVKRSCDNILFLFSVVSYLSITESFFSFKEKVRGSIFLVMWKSSSLVVVVSGTMAVLEWLLFIILFLGVLWASRFSFCLVHRGAMMRIVYRYATSSPLVSSNLLQNVTTDWGILNF